MMKKRGIFFSIDALIALTLILLTILVVYPMIRYSQKTNFIQEDILESLSSLKVGEIDNDYVKNLINQGQIDDGNKTILEQIGEFYVTDKELAKGLANAFIFDVDLSENIGIWYGNDLLASRNLTSIENAKNIDTERQIISGIRDPEEEGGVTAFSAKALLSSNMRTKYFYFGGYVGEGNISARIEYDGDISSAEMELAINKDFEVYINDIASGSFEKSDDEFTPKQYTLSTTNFHSGENIIELKGNYLYIAGGYIKVIYQSNVNYEQTERYYFPGIEGISNLYDGFYIPGQLDSLDISLHLDSEPQTFLTIGDVTVFNSTTSGEETITISNSQLSSLLDYNELSLETIPIRFGVENVSFISNKTKPADIFSVTDLSGSMEECVLNCEGDPIKMIDLAMEANKEFIAILLNDTENRVGLVGYETAAREEDYHPLSDDIISLYNAIDDWKPGGGNCVCCGINRAIQGFEEESFGDVFKSIVVMTDGKIQGKCPNQGTGSSDGDAIAAACYAYEELGIVVHTVGFGENVDEIVLQQMADCGGGDYYYSSIIDLVELYKTIAEDLIKAFYSEQTIEIVGDLFNELFSDSYIEFSYTKEEVPYGLITTGEQGFTDAYSGSFDIPLNSTLLETKVISYSGPRWTKEVEINNTLIYNLTEYGDEYTLLGDPYAINIPISLVEETNVVQVRTGLSPYNSTYGSEHNKIIYTILRNMISYSSLCAFAEGCIWTLQFEDDTNITVSIPTDYNGTETCYYQESKIEYDNNDAIQSAVFKLLELLDFDSDGKIDVKFTEQNLEITPFEITGIPFDWYIEAQIRKWD